MPNMDKVQEMNVLDMTYHTGSPRTIQRIFCWRSMMTILLHTAFMVANIPMYLVPMSIVCMVDLEPPSTPSSLSSTSPLAISLSMRNPAASTNSSLAFGRELSVAITDISTRHPGITNETEGSLELADFFNTTTIQHGCIPVGGDCLAWWSPEKERLTATSVAYTGFQTSGIMITSVAGFLCLIPVDNGWPFMFYVFGTLSLLWVLAWTILSADKPENHPFISEQEKMYIINNRMTSSVVKEQQRTPHLKIMTSLPVWGWLCISNVHIINCITWAAYFPVYVSEVLRFNTTPTGFLMSSTAVSRVVGSFVWAVLGNRLNEIPDMTTNKSRKICVLLGCSVIVICQTGAACIDAELRWVAVALWCFIMLTQSMGAGILPTIPLDMAPRYAGYLSGIAYSLGFMVRIAGPLVFAELTPTNSFEEWRTAWIMLAGTYVVGGAAFLLCGQASLQDWAKNKEQTEVTNFLTQ